MVSEVTYSSLPFICCSFFLSLPIIDTYRTSDVFPNPVSTLVRLSHCLDGGVRLLGVYVPLWVDEKLFWFSFTTEVLFGSTSCPFRNSCSTLFCPHFLVETSHVTFLRSSLPCSSEYTSCSTTLVVPVSSVDSPTWTSLPQWGTPNLSLYSCSSKSEFQKNWTFMWPGLPPTHCKRPGFVTSRIEVLLLLLSQVLIHSQEINEIF